MALDNNADRLRVEFPVRASVLVGLLTFTLDLLYWRVSENPRDSLVFAAATAAAAGGTLAAIYAARTLTFQLNRQATADRAAIARRQYDLRVQAMAYAARWNEPHMEQARKVCREILQMSGDGVKDIDLAMATDGRELRVIHMLNFLEEMATSIEYGVADADILRDLYREAVIAVWRCIGNWALHYRTKSGITSAWTRVESLSKQWS